MRYAVKRISDGLILNCIALDPELAATWLKPEDGLVLVEADKDGGPGDTHVDGQGFIRQPPPEPAPAVKSETELLIDALVKKGVITKEDIADKAATAEVAVEVTP